MRRLAFVLLLIFGAARADAAATLVQSAIATGASTAPACAFSGNTVAGNAVIVKVAWVSGGGTFTLTNWTMDASNLTGVVPQVAILSRLNSPQITSGTNITGSLSGSSVRWTMAIEEWSGLRSAGAFDKSATANTATAASGASGTTATTSQANEMVAVAIVADATSGLPASGTSTDWSSPTNGFTLNVQENNGITLGLASLYKVVSATGTYSTAVSNNQTPDYYGVIATYESTATAYTSQVASGNWSSSATWTPTGVPGAGDTATIANGDVITVDVNTTVGSNASNVGHAITVNGASNVSFGTLQVSSGVTLTLRGTDAASNTLLLLNQFGQFNPQAGSTVLGDTAADYGSVILCKGQLSALGSSGSPITFSVPAANVTWTAVTNESVGGFELYYDYLANLRCFATAHFPIANAAGNGIGSFGNSSLSFNTLVPATILQTEVALPAPGTAISLTNGQYAVDYDAGIVYLCDTTAAATTTAKANYTYGACTKTWGIKNTLGGGAGTSYNSFVADHCVFNWMGLSTGATYGSVALGFRNMKTAGANGSATDRLFKLTNSTMQFCMSGIILEQSQGTLADPILITGNSFFSSSNGTFGANIGPEARNGESLIADYLKIDGNTFVNRTTAGCILWPSSQNPPASAVVVNGLKVTNNVTRCSNFFNSNWPTVCFPDGVFSGNTFGGAGWSIDGRMVQGASGTSGHPVVVSGNTVDHPKRFLHHGSYLTVTGNTVTASYHHGMPASTLDDVYMTDVTITDNLFYGNFPNSGYSSSPFIEVGYNHRQWLNNYVVCNNTTVGHPQGVLGVGDCQDSGPSTLITNLTAVNNLAYNATSGGGTGGTLGVNRQADGGTTIIRAHISRLDYGLYYNVTNQYAATVKGGTFSKGGSNYNALSGASRNLVGLSLHTPNYASGTSGLSVAYTVTTPGVTETLTLTDGTGAGSAVSIVHSHGTLSATPTQNVTTGIYTSTTLTDSGQSWSVTLNNAACPRSRWVKMTSGTQSGVVRAVTLNTATTLTVVPAFTTLPANGDTYTVYESEITLAGGSGSTLHAAIDGAAFAFGTAGTDTTISYTLNDAGNTDPKLVTPAGAMPAGAKLQASSPAKGAGLAIASVTPATDYFGTTFGSPPSVGFAEFSGVNHNGLLLDGVGALSPSLAPYLTLIRD